MKEKFTKGMNGYLMLCLIIVATGALVALAVLEYCPVLNGVSAALISLLAVGFLVINPNEAAVLTLFGKYKGTITQNGFVWVNPFMVKKKISLRARNLTSDQIKVNDKMGNPILISAVLVWKVKDTYRASFEVDDYMRFVDIQSETAVRSLAASYSYDSLEKEETEEITLRSGGKEVNEMLEGALKERLEIAGLEVLEARISNLAYAPEIAGAMLQRQQAIAVVAARQKIVEGAVSMVEMALDMLSEREIVELDEEKKAAMVSNLLVVLTSDKSASPVLNAGTLNH